MCGQSSDGWFNLEMECPADAYWADISAVLSLKESREYWPERRRVQGPVADQK